MDRREQLKKIFENLDENQKNLIEPLLDEVVFLETRMAELKQLPFVEIHPKNPMRQRSTAAAREYKNCKTSYISDLRFLNSLYKSNDPSAADMLMEMLRDFE